MEVIYKIKEKLSKCEGLRYSESPNSIQIQPQDGSGFVVGLRVNRRSFTVNFEGWHEDFESEEEALNCFAFGLSAACRLSVVYRGSIPTKWIVESLQDGAWVPDSETGLLLVPFWRQRRIVHLQNRLLPDSWEHR